MSATRIPEAVIRTAVISVIIIMIFRKTFSIYLTIIYCRRTFTHFSTSADFIRIKTIILLSFAPENYSVFTLMSVYDHCIIDTTGSKTRMIVLSHITILRHQTVIKLKLAACLVYAVASSLTDSIVGVGEKVVLVAVPRNKLIRGFQTAR